MDISVSLQNMENYRETYHSVHNILNKQHVLIIDYLNFISETLHKIKNVAFCKYIVLGGFKTILHVFNMILLYTKNMDLAFYHSQKAFYFYIEFVEQINHDQNAYLKLNSKDAILFVYKKTIFDIPYDVRKKIHNNTNGDEANHEPLDVIRLFKNMYQNMLYYFVQNMKAVSIPKPGDTSQQNTFALEWKKEDFQKMTQHMERKMEKIIFLSFKQNVSYFELLDLFIQRFEKTVHYETYLHMIDHFLKKTIKMKYDFVLLKKKMGLMDLDPLFENVEKDTAYCIQTMLQYLGENSIIH
jgi:hypothetical protein